MVKLFKKKSRKQTKTFKFDADIKLKELPLEEYAHVAYSFKVASLRFERMLKESLLEGYITSTTLEKVSRGFQLESVRDLEIPDYPSLRAMFGSEIPAELAKKPYAKAVTVPKVEPTQITTPEPITPEASSITPSTPTQPEKVPEITPSPTTTPEKPPTPRPTISFSFPDTPSESEPVAPTPKPTVTPRKEIKPPIIPKISFPSVAKPASLDPLTQVKKRREEDRATGIAILRKQMLTELKKIRSVVSEENQ